MENQDQTANGIPGIDDDLPALQAPDELTSLKAKADLMGLSYHPSIGLEKLRDKVRAAIDAEGAPAKEDPAIDTGVAAATSAPAPEPTFIAPAPAVSVSTAAPVQAYQAATLAPAAPAPRAKTLTPRQYADQESVAVPGETVGERRLRMKRHALELVRIVVTNMDPAKKEWEGEIIGAGNGLVGTVTKYIPYGADEGWHVPRILYNVIRDRMAQIFVTVTDPVSKQKVRKGKLIKAFAIDVLDPLTPEELKELAERQAAARSIDA